MSEHGIPKNIPFRTLGPVSGAVKGLIIALLALGGVALVVSIAAGDPARLWSSLLFNWFFWSSLAIGMVMFAVALHLTAADWAWSVRRFALAGVAFLPIAFVLMPIITYFGREYLFHHWLHATGDPVIEAKSAWLNLPSVLIRDFIAVGVLFSLAIVFAKNALRADIKELPAGHRPFLQGWITSGWRGTALDEARRSHSTMNYVGVVAGIVYAFAWGIVAVDLGMSLTPHWFSTMYPVAFFITAFHGGIAATVIAIVLLRPRLRLEDFITVRQFHDIGKLLFAFSVFWMYINWSQYIVIWYGQLPHEQEFFINRLNEPFRSLTGLVVLSVFVIPFFGLLTRPPKKVPGILAGFAVLILAGHWIERYLLVFPSLHEGGPLPFGIAEVGIGLGFMGLFLACYTWFVRSFPMLPSPATLAAQESVLVEVPVSTSKA
jgi:hypothetical protein